MSSKAKKQKEIKPKTKAQNAAEWVLTITIPVLVVLILELFVGKVAYVSGDSMYPTYHNRDMMIVRMIGYEPEDGDVVLIKTGISTAETDDMVIVKRIIGVGGDKITINYDENTVTVNGEVLDEPYINYEPEDPLEDVLESGEVTYTVPEGTVFVMGDNRNDSLDSRYAVVAFQDEENIIGEVCLTLHTGELFD